MEKRQTHWVFDLETLCNCFIAVFEHYKTKERKIFIVHSSQNDVKALIDFLDSVSKNNEYLISFNGISFDSQVLGYLLKNSFLHDCEDGEFIAERIYEYVKNLISKQNGPVRSFPDFPEWKLPFKQIDLFKLHHWDGKGCSLKWTQFSLDWHNVQDMPIEHFTRITTPDQIQTVLDYCINDVRSTKEILKVSKEQINLRASLTQEYGLNLYSASEPKISKDLFLHFLSEKLGIGKKILKEMRSPRNKVLGKDVLLPYYSFQTPEMQTMFNWFKNLDIDYTLNLTEEQKKQRYKYKMSYAGMTTEYGLGGIHGARKGIFEAEDDYIILTSDVTSFYPNLAIENGWSPAHINSDVFCDQYKWFFTERKKIPKSNPKNYVYKIVLNATYGLSKDENCFLYDPEFTMRITLNGQLSLSLLYEMIMLEIPGAIPLMQNTDGVEFMIPKRYKDAYFKICARWEKITKLFLEHDEYQKMFIWDVNNYIAVTIPKQIKTQEQYEQMQTEQLGYVFYTKADSSGNLTYWYQATKCKGRFEWEDQHKKKVGILHKNKSFLVIPKAVFNYCIYGTKPEWYLRENTNIFDYCGAVKAKGDWYFTSYSSEPKVLPSLQALPLEEKKKYLTDRGWVQLEGTERWVKTEWHTIISDEMDFDTAFEQCAEKTDFPDEKKLQKMNRFYISKKGSKFLKKNMDGRVQRVTAGKWYQTLFNVHEDKPFHLYDVDTYYYLKGIYNEISSIKPVSVSQIQNKKQFKQIDMFA